MNFESTIGLRYLFSKKGNFLLSVITIISILGVALGVMALIVVLSVVSGFENDFREKILGNNAHLILLGAARRDITGADDLVKEVSKINGIKAAAPFLYQEVLLYGHSGKSSGVIMYGIDPKRAGDVISVGEDMRLGRLADLETDGDGPPGILIGHELSRSSLFLIPGDTVDVVSPMGEMSPFGMGPKILRFEVKGVFKSGLYEYDSRTVYTNLKDAQKLLNYGNRVSGVQISIEELDDAVAMSQKVQEKVGDNYLVRHWMELNRDLFSAFKLEKTVFFIVLTMIILVAAFNIIGTLIMLVTEKSREIAILRSLGATKASVLRIFVKTGCIIGGVGTVIGLVLGYVLCILLEKYIQFPLNSNVYQIDHLPVDMHALDFLYVGVAAMLISFMATIYPSLKASIMEPMDGLRYE